MDTRFLETFLIVAEHGSMAEASRRLGVTPAAIAQRMQALEDEIGAALLARAGRQVRPTEAGQAILAQSRRILSDVRGLRGLASADALVGELRVGAINTALTGLLPAALRQIVETRPGMEIYILPGTSAELYEKVVDGGLDAAVIVRPPFALQKTLDWQLLRSEPLVLVCPEAWKHEPVEALLRTRPFIRYDRNNWGGRLTELYMKAAGFAPREWLELDSLEAIAVMVGHELGVSVVPRWLRPWPQGIAVAELPLPGTQWAKPREIGLLWQRTSAVGRLVRVLGVALADADGTAPQRFASPKRT